MKDSKDMLRIVMIAAAFLIMFAIIGFSLSSLNHISIANQRNRDKEQGESFAVVVAQTTTTTGIWDYLKSKETTTEVIVVDGDENAPADPDAPSGDTPDAPQDSEPEDAPVQTEAPPEPTNFVFTMD